MELEEFIELIKKYKLNKDKEVIMFCGAGVSKKAGIPSGPEFDEFFKAEKLNKEEFEEDNNRLMIFWRSLLSKFNYTDNHTKIIRIADRDYINKIITANYDMLFEQCIEKEFPYWIKKKMIRQRGITKYFFYDKKILLKIHGDINQDKATNINLGLSCGSKIEDCEKAWNKIFSGENNKILWVIGYRGKNTDFAFELIKSAVESNKIEKVYWMHRGKIENNVHIAEIIKNIGENNIELIKIGDINQVLHEINKVLFNEVKNDRNSENKDSIDIKSIKKSYEIANKTIGLLEKIDHKIIEDMHKAQDEFNSLLTCGKKIKENDTKLYILRRYNSYTPILPRNNQDSKGGGYFLIHNGKGIVIDPGYDFLENFFKNGYDIKNNEFFRLNHINAIVITHAHNDHYGDFDSIQNMVYQYNKRVKLNKKLCKVLKCVLEINEVSSFEEKYSLINDLTNEIKIITEDDPNHKEAQEALVLLKYYINKDEIGIKNKIKSIAEYIIEFENQEKIEIDLFVSRSAYKAIDGLIPSNANSFKSINILNPGDEKEWNGIKIKAIKVKHQDLYGKDGAIGLVFQLNLRSGRDFTIGLTSDTGYFIGLEDNFLECDVLVPHIGSIKPKELNIYEKNKLSAIENANCKNIGLNEELNKRYLIPKVNDGDVETAFYGNHLGILGLTTLLAATIAQNQKLKLVVISEYGEEMNCFRTDITKILGELFEEYKELKIITGDIGLEIDFNKVDERTFTVKEVVRTSTTIEYEY
ncbi:MBL fold metallo-hydrolase [Clostridium tagluense]|uniref:Metallo-beta-lactamase domain-containing protein n=1 Tax=Clostridium tagluense TaxID=360422 RepID=A0A401UNI1_9CLOT|nr:MBL fold metallo-hydrolase [Clostridium tagluense]GCD11089.1 hypothetical protein Ctaglu_27120 [Clostridium tagluense]